MDHLPPQGIGLGSFRASLSIAWCIQPQKWMGLICTSHLHLWMQEKDNHLENIQPYKCYMHNRRYTYRALYTLLRAIKISPDLCLNCSYPDWLLNLACASAGSNGWHWISCFKARANSGTSTGTSSCTSSETLKSFGTCSVPSYHIHREIKRLLHLALKDCSLFDCCHFMIVVVMTVVVLALVVVMVVVVLAVVVVLMILWASENP